MTPTVDPRIDSYIADAPEFAQPILIEVRTATREACPDVTETLKWGHPFFDFKGSIIGISAHKEHVNIMVPKGELIPDLQKWISESTEEGPGTVGRVTTVDQLPDRARLVSILKDAADLNARGIKAPKAPPKANSEPITTPDYLTAALERSDDIQSQWDQLSPSKRKEYVVWMEGAKTEATRNKRLAQAIEWIEEGKGLGWKYER